MPEMHDLHVWKTLKGLSRYLINKINVSPKDLLSHRYETNPYLEYAFNCLIQIAVCPQGSYIGSRWSYLNQRQRIL